jgi:hypothetical protein
MVILVNTRLSEANMYSIIHGSSTIDELYRLYGLCHEISLLNPSQTEQGFIGHQGTNVK